MSIFTGSLEIQILCWSMVLGLAQLMIATTLAVKDQGLAYSIGSRDSAGPPVTRLTARLQRAFGNFRQTFVYFAVAVLVVTALNKNGPMSALGAQIYFWSRLAYVPAYATGITGLRTALWTLSVVGLVMVLLAAAA